MKYKISPSVINFKDKIEKVWKLKEWQGFQDADNDVLFFGLYLPYDFDVFWHFKGKRTVFWCGSDILRLPDEPEHQRRLKLFPEAKHYCENEIEQEELKKFGVSAEIIYSFLDDKDDFPVSYQHSENPNVFLSGHPNREDEYGWNLVEKISKKLPDFFFHLYGSGEPFKKDNIIFHGIVPPEQFNEEVKTYQCGLRPNEHDGNSEIAMKSVLCGGYPITRIKYPHIWNYETKDELIILLKKLKEMKEPNIEARNFWREEINKFPFLQ